MLRGQKSGGFSLRVQDREEEEPSEGFTLIELMIVIAMIATLVGIAVPAYLAYVNKAKIVRAISELKQIDRAIVAYKIDREALPHSLDDTGYGNLLDPWGNPYQYLNLATAKQGKARKDRFIVPLNSDYDLYSMGRDGQSKPALTAKDSRDDIVRANDGSYIGLASLY